MELWLRATLVLQSSNMKVYRQRCQELAEAYGGDVSYDPKPCLIAGDAVVNLSASAKRAAELVDATDVTSANLSWRLFTRSLAEYRCGKHRESIASLEDARIARGSRSSEIYNKTSGYLLQAMAHHQLGEREQSHEWFRKAVELMDSQIPKAGRDDIDIWWDWIHCQVLRARPSRSSTAQIVSAGQIIETCAARCPSVSRFPDSRLAICSPAPRKAASMGGIRPTPLACYVAH